MADLDKGKTKESKVQEDAPAQSQPGAGKDAQRTKQSNGACCGDCCKVLFVLLSVVVLIESIAKIAVTVTTAIFTKLYDSEQSGRLVAMVILALLAAVTISMVLNALVAIFRNHSKPLYAAAIVLFIVALIQAVIAGVSVRVKVEDELLLTKSLQQSFQLAKENNPRHTLLWTASQFEMTCCGVFGPEDYRSANLPVYFPPNVPISCCPAYDPSRSELVQERERETCKSRRTYYREGCEVKVVDGFKSSAGIVMALTIALIVAEVVLGIVAAILAHKIKKHKREWAAETLKEPVPHA